MPRNYKKMTTHFTEADIQSAFLLVKSGAESLQKRLVPLAFQAQPYPDGLIIKTLQTLDLDVKLQFL